MKSLIDLLHNGDFVSFKEQLLNRLDQLADEKLTQLKVEMVDEMFDLEEAARIKVVKLRIRGGKIQRRKRVSGVKGYTFRGGKLTRLSSQERRNRKLAARKSKFKRRAKMRQSIIKRQRSLRRRKAMGV